MNNFIFPAIQSKKSKAQVLTFSFKMNLSSGGGQLCTHSHIIVTIIIIIKVMIH